MGITSFKEGGLTSDSISREYNDEFVSQAVVEVAATTNKNYFSNRADMEDMPERHGTVFTKKMRFSLLHKDNMSDLNLDAEAATVIGNAIYIVDATHTLVSTFDIHAYITNANLDKLYDLDETEANKEAIIVAARAAAKAAAEAAKGAGETVVSGAGMIANGFSPYALNSASIAHLPENGGVVNMLHAKDILISASITKHGIGTKWTVDSQKLGSWPRSINRNIKDIADAQATIRELQVQYDLLDAARINAMVATTVDYLGASDIEDLGPVNVVSFEALEAYQLELLEDEVPTDTKMISGVDLVDTVTANEAFVVNINRELMSSLRRITGPDGKLAWEDVEHYTAGSTEKMVGEIGKVKGLMFRFVLTPDLISYPGAGLESVAADDAAAQAAGVADKATYDAAAAKMYKTQTADGIRLNVYNMLVIGSDSFNCLSFKANSSSASYIPPVKDNFNDQHGEIAGVSAKWWHGTLIYRPERIKTLLVTATR